mgnify:CR=1 FL=1
MYKVYKNVGEFIGKLISKRTYVDISAIVEESIIELGRQLGIAQKKEEEDVY